MAARRRTRTVFCLFGAVLLAACRPSASGSELVPDVDSKEESKNSDEEAKGVQNLDTTSIDLETLELINATFPMCGEDEFMTSNGTHLLCRPLPDVGFCDCPDIVPPGAPTVPTPVAPQPPPGCQVFLPPTRGAFVCLRNDDVIYCHVLCDHRFEFSTTPFNPYFCGEETGFNWMDFAGFIHTSLPDCTGFRHRLRTLHRLDFYLPSPCYGLTSNTIRALMFDLQMVLKEEGACGSEDVDDKCPLENIFLQCPQVAGSVTFYNDVP